MFFYFWKEYLFIHAYFADPCFLIVLIFAFQFFILVCKDLQQFLKIEFRMKLSQNHFRVPNQIELHFELQTHYYKTSGSMFCTFLNSEGLDFCVPTLDFGLQRFSEIPQKLSTIPVKVRKFQKQFFFGFNSSKKRTKYLQNFALANRADVFRPLFGRIKNKKKVLLKLTDL